MVSNRQASNTVRIGVTASAPQILNITNQDGTPNSADHPAKAGSVVTLYVSGLGVTTPPSVDGLLSAPPLPVPAVAVRLFVPRRELQPQFVGAAPGLIAGITQVNVQIPADLNNPPNPGISVNSAFATLYLTR